MITVTVTGVRSNDLRSTELFGDNIVTRNSKGLDSASVPTNFSRSNKVFPSAVLILKRR